MGREDNKMENDFTARIQKQVRGEIENLRQTMYKLENEIIHLQEDIQIEITMKNIYLNANLQLRKAMEKALLIMEKVSRYDSYHDTWESMDYENAPPEEVILRAIEIIQIALTLHT
jgi:hypothetical protein